MDDAAETSKNDKSEDVNPITKNLCYNMDTNKFMINDSENNHYQCDIFGRKKIKFLPFITGSMNRYKYPIKLQDYNTSFQTKENFSSNSKRSNISTSFTNTNSPKRNKRQIDYHPIIRKFEGYSKFPRPIGPPLTNIPDYEIQEKDKRKLIDNLNNYFDEASAKKNILRKNENKGLTFLTADLNEYDSIKHDTEESLKLIENSMNDFREIYKLKLNIMHKNPNVKALNQFKKNLLLNKNSKIINGRILDEPCDKIRKNYNLIQSIVNRTGLSCDRKNERPSNFYNKISKFTKKNRTDSKFDNTKRNSKNISIIVGPDRLNDMCKSRDFTLGRTINMDFGLSSDKKHNITIGNINSNENEINKLPEISKTNIINRNDENAKLNNLEDTYKETEETATNNVNFSKINENPTKVKSLDEKINDNELSFISYMSENEKKYEEENIQNIKSAYIINKKGEHNNRLLAGYQETEKIPPTIVLPKTRILKLKTNGDLYKENINLLRMTNKEAFKIQEQKDLYDLKLLEKKLKIQSINANNVMKGKTLKINKDKNND
jgi:hypothetical protein